MLGDHPNQLLKYTPSKNKAIVPARGRYFEPDLNFKNKEIITEKRSENTKKFRKLSVGKLTAKAKKKSTSPSPKVPLINGLFNLNFEYAKRHRIMIPIRAKLVSKALITSSQ